MMSIHDHQDSVSPPTLPPYFTNVQENPLYKVLISLHPSVQLSNQQSPMHAIYKRMYNCGIQGRQKTGFCFQCPILTSNLTSVEAGWSGQPFRPAGPNIGQKKKSHKSSGPFDDLPFLWGLTKGMRDPKLVFLIVISGSTWTILDIYQGL